MPVGGHGPVYPVVPLSFFIAVAPCGSVVPAAIVDTVGGMPVISQCVNVPFGASGSSTRSATLFVSFGTSLHISGGGRLSPSHVYSAGIAPPSENAGDDTFSCFG